MGLRVRPEELLVFADSVVAFAGLFVDLPKVEMGQLLEQRNSGSREGIATFVSTFQDCTSEIVLGRLVIAHEKVKSPAAEVPY